MKGVVTLFNRIATSCLPNAYTFALLLTAVSFVLALIFTDSSIMTLISYWGDSFWDLLAFSMQMSLILVVGCVIADTKIIKIALTKISSFPNSQVSATMLVTFVSIAFCYINWGLGLVVSAVLTTHIGKRLENVNMGLLVASAYSGFLVWHAGLSGSIPLKLTKLPEKLQVELNLEGINIQSSLFSSFNITLLLVTICSLLIINYLFAKNDKSRISINNLPITQKEEKLKKLSLAQRIDRSMTLKVLSFAFFSTYLVQYFYLGGSIKLNIMIFIFMTIAILLHRNSIELVQSFEKNIKASSGIFLQFMLYAGIMGVIAKSGLGNLISEMFIHLSTEKTFLLNTYLSAGVLNFFVPSGGGQWVIQGPILLPAAKSLGVDLSKTAMAIAWGDAWTNMVQPFWALPILSISGLELKDIMSYLVSIFLIIGSISSLLIYLMS